MTINAITLSLTFAAAVTALVLLLLIAGTIHGDGHGTPAAEQAELTRLTAPLPPERQPGRHRPEHLEAIGTQTQRVGDTMAIDLAEVAEAVAAVTR